MNLDQQMAAYGIGRIQFIIALQAIVDWGNAVGSEAQSITQYNTALADLEIATGTILESHGVAFYEERFGFLGPLGRFAQNRCYPFTLPATPTVDRYDEGEIPSEQSFDLRDPMEDREERRNRFSIPPPLPLAPLPLDEAARFQRLPEALPAGN